jgi:hypothetical protein
MFDREDLSSMQMLTRARTRMKANADVLHSSTRLLGVGKRSVVVITVAVIVYVIAFCVDD